jgi:hypothetical protein
MYGGVSAFDGRFGLLQRGKCGNDTGESGGVHDIKNEVIGVGDDNYTATGLDGFAGLKDDSQPSTGDIGQIRRIQKEALMALSDDLIKLVSDLLECEDVEAPIEVDQTVSVFG